MAVNAKKARKRDTYDSRRNSEEVRGTTGDFTLDPKSGIRTEVYRPDYKKGKLVFRPWPELMPEKPSTHFEPGRLSVARRHYSKFLIRIDGVSIGIKDKTRATFHLYQPNDANGKNNPYEKFYWSCWRACERGEAFGSSGKFWRAQWNPLLKGSKDSGAAIPKPGSMWYSQGDVYQFGDKVAINPEEKRKVAFGADPEDPLPIIRMPGGAVSFLDLFDTEATEVSGDTEKNPNLAYKYGDPVGKLDQKTKTISGGYLFTMFNPDVCAVHAKSKAHPNSPYRACTWDGKPRDKKSKGSIGYEVAIARQLSFNKQVVSAEYDAAGVQRIFDKSYFWLPDKEAGEAGLLYFPEFEEIAEYMARVYASVPNLLKWAWFDTPEYLNESVLGILNARTTSVAPAASAEDDDEEGDDDEGDEPVTKSKKTDKKSKSILGDEELPKVRGGKTRNAKLDDDDDDLEDEDGEESDDDADDSDDADDDTDDTDDADDDASDDDDSEDDSDDDDSDDDDDSEDDDADADSDDDDSDDDDSEDDSDDDDSEDDDSDDDDSDDDDSDDEEESDDEDDSEDEEESDDDDSEDEEESDDDDSDDDEDDSDDDSDDDEEADDLPESKPVAKQKPGRKLVTKEADAVEDKQAKRMKASVEAASKAKGASAARSAPPKKEALEKLAKAASRAKAPVEKASAKPKKPIGKPAVKPKTPVKGAKAKPAASGKKPARK